MAPHYNPEWVLVGGEIRRVSDFFGLPIGRRPTAYCTGCGEEVKFKLGRQRRPHYAHLAHSACSLTSGESALHLNTKHAIAERLRTIQQLLLWSRCQGCNDREPFLWLDGWDEVQTEKAIPGSLYRPDVSLWRDGRVIAAVEVVVTHPLDPTTQRFYEEQGIQWVEVGGGEPEGGSWARSLLRMYPSPPERTCERCAAIYAARAERERQRQEEEREREQYFARINESARRRHTKALEEARAKKAQLALQIEQQKAREVFLWKRPKWWTVVDRYGPDGRVERDVYRVVEVGYGPEVEFLRLLWIRPSEMRPLRATTAFAVEAMKAEVHTAALQHDKERDTHFSFSHRRGWQTWRGDSADEDLSRFPLAFAWAGKKHGWIATSALNKEPA